MTDPHAGQPVIQVGPPPGASHAVAVLIHGRNASPRNILDLVPRLDRPGFTYLAPAAAGNSWYPLSFLAETSKNEPYLSSALARLDAVVADVVSAGVSENRIVWLGFSQGACLASEFVYRRRRAYGGLIAFSGGLIGPPGTTWTAATTSASASRDRSLADMPVFLGCSDVDAHVPKVRVDETAEVFAALGAAVTKRLYPGMGHLVDDDEIAHAQAVMDRLTAPSASSV